MHLLGWGKVGGLEKRREREKEPFGSEITDSKQKENNLVQTSTAEQLICKETFLIFADEGRVKAVMRHKYMCSQPGKKATV